VVLHEWTGRCLHCTGLEGSQSVQRMQIVCFLLLLCSGAFCRSVSKKERRKREKYPNGGGKYVVTNMDTQETYYSVYRQHEHGPSYLFNLNCKATMCCDVYVFSNLSVYVQLAVRGKLCYKWYTIGTGGIECFGWLGPST